MNNSITVIVIVVGLPILLSTGLFAQTDNDEQIETLKQQIEQMKKQFSEMQKSHDEEIEQLKNDLNNIKSERYKSSYDDNLKKQLTELLDTQDNAAATSPGGLNTMSRAFQSFNPEISVIGDFLLHAVDGEKDETPPAYEEGLDHSHDGGTANEDRFQFREVELAFSSSVDPFARADIFVHVHEHDGEWHAGLCEGYLTLLSLPFDTQARVGKFRSAFGKANQLHTHNMPWVDRPNVITNFFAEEGMSEEGLELSWLIPNPWDNYLELTFDLQNNENGQSFAGSEADDVMYVGHLKNFSDLSETSTLEWGLSYATAPNDHGHGSRRTHLEGLDLTYKWRPQEEGLYKSFTWQAELLFSQKDQAEHEEEEEHEHVHDDTVDSWGMYSSLEYQFARRWSVFGRYDYSQFPDDNNSSENAFGTGITFKQSEYCFGRMAGKHTRGDFAQSDNEERQELWLQLNFGIGPHRAHTY